jgi:hypothetical protein
MDGVDGFFAALRQSRLVRPPDEYIDLIIIPAVLHIDPLRLLDYPPMTAELLAYDAERLPSGAMRYNAPSGQHDDCVVSLMLAWEAAGRQRVGRLVA